MSIAIPYPRAQSANRPAPRLLSLIALIALVFGIAVLLSNGDPTVFAMLALIPLAGVIWYRPVAGLYLALAGALLLEQYAIAGLTDPITMRIPLFTNIGGTQEYWNAWTHENLSWLTANLLELMLVWTGLAWYVREHRAHGTPFHLGRLGGALLLFLGAILFSAVFGLLAGGDFKVVLWEIRALFYMGACYLLAANLLKTPGQVRIVGWIVILCIGVKTLQGIYRYLVPFGGDLTGVYAVTGHEDALFFDTALILAAALVVYGGPIRQKLVLWGLTPFLFVTLLLTRRRAALVALGVGALSFLVTLPAAQRKWLPRLFVPLFLIGLAYVGVFYNSDSVLAKPVQLIKSVYAPDNARDASSNQYRDIEQYDVLTTIRHNPLLGVGFGNKYEQPVPLVPIDFTLRDWIPHNEILWIWLKMGTLGFIIFWLFIGSAIIQGSLVLRRLRDPYFQALAAMIIAFVLMQVIIAYADLQLTFYRNMVYLGVMLGLLVRLEALDPLLKRLTAGQEDAPQEHARSRSRVAGAEPAA